MKEKCKLFGRILIFIFCIGILVGGLLFVTNKDNNKVNTLELANPLTEVSSASEMTDYLGFNVPIIKDKEVSKYIVIGKDHKANHARVIYKDKSEFDMEQGDLDVSGIYGSKLLKEESIGGVKVIINTYEDIIYAIWTYNDYSYSYSMVNSNEETINLEINKIMGLIR